MDNKCYNFKEQIQKEEEQMLSMKIMIHPISVEEHFKETKWNKEK